MTNVDQLQVLVYSKFYFRRSFTFMFSELNSTIVDDYTPHVSSNGSTISPSLNQLFQQYSRHLIPVISNNHLLSCIPDIIRRCRYLRNIPKRQAYAKALQALSVWSYVIRGQSYDACFAQLTDDYIGHALSLVSAHNHCPMFTFMNSYISNVTEICTLHTGSSSNHQITSIPNSAVKSLTSSLLSTSHVQTYGHRSISYSFRKHISMVILFQFKYIYLLLVDILLNRDLRFYSNAQPYLPQPTRLASFIPHSFYTSWTELCSSPLVTDSSTKLVYVPLGVFPEASSDYWVDDHSLLDSIEHISRVASNYPHLTFLIKDHFHMNGIRSKANLMPLLELKNVLLIDPSIPSNNILEHFNLVLFCGGGSPGLEALLRNIPVFTWCSNSPWYSRFTSISHCIFVGSSAFPFTAYESLFNPNISLSLASFISPESMIKSILETSLPFNYVHSPSRITPDTVSALINQYTW